jgi:hypothetical protein
MPPHLPAIAAVAFLAAFVQGITGFGSALLAMPLLALLLGVRVAAPLVALLSLAMNVALLIPARRRLPWGRAWPLLGGSLVGIPFGVLFLDRADARLARVALGAALVASGLLLQRCRLPAGGGVGPALGTGAVAGLLGGAFNFSGPPVILYAASRPWAKEETHATLQLYFLASNVAIVAGQALSGLTTAPVVRAAATALPALAAGALAGWAVHRRVGEESFRRVLQLALVAAGLVLLFAK